jgi:AraC-type DNA-binding domain-containing proteins
MIHRDFPDLQWLKRQIDQGFAKKQSWKGQPFPTAGWPNVVLQVKSKEVFRDRIKGPFSIFGNLSGTSQVSVDNRKVVVGNDHFFVTNAGQEYTLEVDRKGAETFNVHFGENFADDVLTSLTSSTETLLENQSGKHFTFHNRLIRKSEEVNNTILQLQQCADPLKEEELLVTLFTILFTDQLNLIQKEKLIPSIRQSTKEELLKRVLLSVDYIQTHYNQSLSLEELAQISCLSKFHYLRLFKIAFQQTPYQYITSVRLQRAKELLTAMPALGIHQISKQVGYKDSSSFSRSFYQNTGFYPTQIRG